MKRKTKKTASNNPEDIILSTHAAAERCFVSARTIRNWIQQHQLKAFQTVGGQYKIRLSDLEEFVRKNNMLMKDMTDEKKKILCVDDDPEIHEILRINLSAMGYLTEFAINGIEAGTKVMNFKPDLMIIDMIMPGMNGFETIDYFKKKFEPTKHIPIIALTALNSLADIEKIYQAGADAYLAKPIKIKELSEHIKRLLNL